MMTKSEKKSFVKRQYKLTMSKFIDSMAYYLTLKESALSLKLKNKMLIYYSSISNI